MREILFRGKRIDNSEWAYGFYGQFHNRPKLQASNSHQIFELSEHAFIGGSCIGGFWRIVIPETVGQFTGLLDKNGKKIFEGDIIKVVTEDTHEERFIEVCIGEFTDDGSGDLFIGAYLKYDSFTVSAGQIKECGADGVEVVGNIHDNPELLKA